MRSKKEKVILDDSSLNKPIYTKESIEKAKLKIERKEQDKSAETKLC